MTDYRPPAPSTMTGKAFGFAPDPTGRWWAEFSYGESETWSEPVIGWASRVEWDPELGHFPTYGPVVIHDGGVLSSIAEYLGDRQPGVKFTRLYRRPPQPPVGPPL